MIDTKIFPKQSSMVSYIVAMDISSERSDTLTLIPFMERLESNLCRKFEKVIVDVWKKISKV